MIVEGYVLLMPEYMEGSDGTYHVAAGSYETEEQRLVDVEAHCVGCSGAKQAGVHIPPYQFIGFEAYQIRGRLVRLRQTGVQLCAGCAGRFVADA